MRQNAPCEGQCDRDYARSLASQGRHGDTLVAHISPLEAAILRLLGGSGTINPKTGLVEFWGLGGGVSSGGHGDVGDGTGGAASGGKKGSNGGRGNENSATGSRNASQRDSSYGGGYSGGTADGTGGNIGSLGDAYGRLARGLGLNGQPAPAPTSKYGNENAAIGSLTKESGNPSLARDMMRSGLIGVNSLAGGASENALKVALGGPWAAAMANMYGRWTQDPSFATTEDTINTLAGALGLGPMGLSILGSMIQAGIGIGDTNAAIKEAIDRGLIDGQNVGTNDSTGTISRIGGSLFGAFNSGQVNTAKLTHDIASGQFTGDLGGYARDHSTGGNNNFDHQTVAQNAQQANAGGGSITALTPDVPTPSAGATARSPGLIEYLIQNPGLLKGFAFPSRFGTGTGTVAPVRYGQPYA